VTKQRLNRVLILIPTCNDFELLADITSDLQKLGDAYRIMIIDDGSTVKIDPSAFASDVLYFRLPTNFGLGTATHIAFDHALRHDYEAVVRMDADGQHPLDLIPRLLEPIALGDADLVVGTRVNRHEGSGLRAAAATLVRYYLSLVARLMTQNRTPRDVNSGFYAVSAKAILKLNSTQLERYPEPQMYVLAGRQRLTIKEIAIQQQARRYGSSTITIGRALGMFYRFNIFVLAELLQRPKRL